MNKNKGRDLQNRKQIYNREEAKSSFFEDLNKIDQEKEKRLS